MKGNVDLLGSASGPQTAALSGLNQKAPGFAGIRYPTSIADGKPKLAVLSERLARLRATAFRRVKCLTTPNK
jgi:hypothetical protein